MLTVKQSCSYFAELRTNNCDRNEAESPVLYEFYTSLSVKSAGTGRVRTGRVNYILVVAEIAHGNSILPLLSPYQKRRKTIVNFFSYGWSKNQKTVKSRHIFERTGRLKYTFVKHEIAHVISILPVVFCCQIRRKTIVNVFSYD